MGGLKYEGTFSWHTGNTSTRDWATAQSYKVTQIRGYEYGAYTEYDPSSHHRNCLMAVC